MSRSKNRRSRNRRKRITRAQHERRKQSAAAAAASVEPAAVSQPTGLLKLPHAAPPQTEHTVHGFQCVVPRIPESRERVIRALALLALLYAWYWIWWRWTQSLNPEAMWYSLPLIIAETWGVLTTTIFVFNCWRLTHRDPGPAPPGLSVDVFITCYDEPLEILRRTALGAKAMRYPHRTYILDDGKRADMKALAIELGVGYIRRVGNDHAKAGNLNFALSVTSGDLIMQLDADHVPLPNALDRLLGYFRDPKVAFVMSPQEYYNTDSFTHVVNPRARHVWEESRIFYQLIQPGKDTYNACFNCGTSCVLRRAALEDIGGYSTQTITEDYETSMLLHARGWKSCYHPEMVAYGIAARSPLSFQTQRLRWGQGTMQCARKMNPLLIPGLTPAQRLLYFSGIMHYFDGWQKAIYVLAPLVYLTTGILPIIATSQDFWFRLVPYIALTIVSFELLARGTGYTLLTERYSIAKFVTYMHATLALFTNKRLAFKVTPKGKGEVPLQVYAPQLVLVVLYVVVMLWALVALGTGLVNYGGAGNALNLAFVLALFWASWNLYFAAQFVRQCITAKQYRNDHRFYEHVTVGVQQVAPDGSLSAPQYAMTENLNGRGLAYRATTAPPPGTRLMLELPLSTGRVHVAAEVMHVREVSTRYGTLCETGVAFHDVPIATQDAIELHCTHHSVPILRATFRQTVNPLLRLGESMSHKRRDRRHLLQLPGRLVVHPLEGGDRRESIGFVEEISRTGLRLLLEEPLAPGTRISYDVPGTALAGSGVVRFSDAIETPMSVRFVVGVQLDAPSASPSRRLVWPGRLKPQAA